MHTLMIIAIGLALLAVCVIAAKMLGSGAGRGALWFLPLWLAGALINMWVGVSRAGYSIAAETPIFLIVFAVPAAAALLLKRSFERS